jgi:hypothetical protein
MNQHGGGQAIPMAPTHELVAVELYSKEQFGGDEPDGYDTAKELFAKGYQLASVVQGFMTPEGPVLPVAMFVKVTGVIPLDIEAPRVAGVSGIVVRGGN